MTKIFISGSCRIQASLKDGFGKFETVHSYVGGNFLGKLHNTKQHIQFMRFIKDEIAVPDDILRNWLVVFAEYNGEFSEDSSPIQRKQNIAKEIDNCDWYLFEICSLKIHKKNGFFVHFEHTTEPDNYTVQTEQELWDDLRKIHEMIPANKKILFQTHFRPNIIYDDPAKIIEKRETIFNVVLAFCEETANTFILDPSNIIKPDLAFFDGDTHFSPSGHEEHFKPTKI
jgi:hypothetical protein